MASISNSRAFDSDKRAFWGRGSGVSTLQWLIEIVFFTTGICAPEARGQLGTHSPQGTPTFTMEEPDGSYAPQSPDLTAYHSAYSSNQPQPSYHPPPQPFYQQSSYLPPNQFDSYEFAQQPIQPELVQQSHTMPRKRVPKHAVESDEWHSGSDTHGLASNGKKQKMEVDCDKPAPGVEEGIELKTKFPVARIKRIMQADEDIGKVAQVTPTAVCK